MSDTALTNLFAPAPTKANAQGQDVTETAKPKRTRRTKEQIINEAAAATGGPVPVRKRRTRKAVDDQAILKACMKKLRQAQDPGRVVATLRIMFE